MTLPSRDRAGLAAAIHDTDLMVVVAVTGGGVAVVTDLLGVPGASRTVLEVVIPYAGPAMEDFIGARVDQAVSETTAEAMAAAALRRARALAPPDAPVAGVGCTAALVTDRERRGEDRAHVALALPSGTQVRTLHFDKGDLDRLAQDRLVADLVLDGIAAGAGLTAPSSAWTGGFP